LESGSIATDIPDQVRWDANDQAVVRDVCRHHCPGSDHGETPDGDPGNDDYSGAERRAVANVDRTDLPVVRLLEIAGRGDGAREAIVRQADARPDEDSFLQVRTMVKIGSVLDLAVRADANVEVYVNLFANYAVVAYSGSLANLSAVPDSHPIPKHRLRRDVSGRVDIGLLTGNWDF